MIVVRLLFVAAILFCHSDAGGILTRTQTGTSSASLASNADAGIDSETQQELAAHSSASDKPSSSNSAAAAPAAASSSSSFRQNAGTHSQDIAETSWASKSWRIWKYECNDLPAKCPRCQAKIADILKKNKLDARNLTCKLCKKFWHLHKDPKTDVGVISPYRWSIYMTKTESIFHNGPILFDALQSSDFEDIWPAQMSKKIKFTKQVGTAIFREGIFPDLADDSLLHPKGGYFSLTVLTKVGELKNYDRNMNKMKELYTSLLQYFFGISIGDGLEAGPEVRAAVCGIFIRAEVHLKDPNITNYNDEKSLVLPVRFRFQVWLRDWDAHKDVVDEYLKKWTAAKVPAKDFANLTAPKAPKYGFDELNFYKMSDRRA